MFLELAWRLGGLRAERSGASSNALSWFPLRLSGFFRVPAHIVRSIENRKMWNSVLPLNTSLCHYSDNLWGKQKFKIFQKAHWNSTFSKFRSFQFDFRKMWNGSLPQKGTSNFPFSSVNGRPKFTLRSVKEMRKQVQKERCTKIMLTKCKAVCCLYNKVQLAAAKMLDAEPEEELEEAVE